MDSGAEDTWCRWQTGKVLVSNCLKPAQVRLRSANGDDMGVSGSFLWCVDGAIIKWWSSQLWWRLELPGLCVSATKLVSAGYSIEDEANSVCLASQWRRLHTASTLR